MKPEATPAICLSAVCMALFAAAAALAQDTLTVLVFHAPDVDVIVAAYDTEGDCDEVAFTLQRYTTVATYSCEERK